jgi:hypothetical protein
MSYTPTNWSTGDTITASAMNKIENGIANAGGCAVVNFSVSGFPTQSWQYGAIVYATYDSNESKWVVISDNEANWVGIWGFANEAPDIIPPYLTIVPDGVGVFFVADSWTPSVTGNISITNLYYHYGSVITNACRITGNGSISLTYTD